MDFIKKDREELTRLRAQHRIVFSGCQIFQTSKPFHAIRRFYGDVKVAIVVFYSTRHLAEQTRTEYVSLLTRPFLRCDPNMRLWRVPPTVWIDGTQKGWENQVAMFARRDLRKTLIVMEGVHFEEELREHYDRMWTVLDALERVGTP